MCRTVSAEHYDLIATGSGLEPESGPSVWPLRGLPESVWGFCSLSHSPHVLPQSKNAVLIGDSKSPCVC